MAKKGRDGKGGSTKSSWGNKIVESLLQERGLDVNVQKKTTLAGILSQDRSQFFQIQFDTKNEISLFCPPEKLIENVNSILIQRQNIGHFLGDFDFEAWFEDFSYEFKKNLPSTKATALIKLTPWGKNIKNRPKKLNLLSQTEANRLGYQKILFWPDRENEQMSILLQGTYYELRNQMLDMMRPLEGETTDTKGISEARNLSGHPKLIFSFRQISPLTKEQKAGMKSNFTLTLTEYSDYEDGYDLRTISIKDLKRFKSKILELLVEPLFKLERGSYTCTYQDWKRGYANWSNFQSVENATEFYRRLVAIKGDKFEAIRMRSRENEFSKTSKRVKVLGQDRELPIRFQRATLGLWSAHCYIPTSREKIYLFSRGARPGIDPRLQD